MTDAQDNKMEGKMGDLVDSADNKRLPSSAGQAWEEVAQSLWSALKLGH